MQFVAIASSVPLPEVMPILWRPETELSELETVRGVLADATIRAVARSEVTRTDSTERVALLHALAASEIDYLRSSGAGVPQWLLSALDETEWAGAAA